MSSDERSAALTRLKCAECGVILGSRLLSDVVLPSPDGPGGRLRCPACGFVNHVPRSRTT
ncbi:hypothetical protein [Halogeometricum pallidum]|uniref:hypothetical protein n=1 Tax=Halogeometricum pallidum TaxID=411361 RepID=UPI000677D836|nr:hypothetical protein [Halogeometricum pallidum]